MNKKFILVMVLLITLIGLMGCDEPAEEKETYCSDCKTQSVLWNFDEKIWYCQKCGKVV